MQKLFRNFTVTEIYFKFVFFILIFVCTFEFTVQCHMCVNTVYVFHMGTNLRGIEGGMQST